MAGIYFAFQQKNVYFCICIPSFADGRFALVRNICGISDF